MKQHPRGEEGGAINFNWLAHVERHFQSPTTQVESAAED